MVRLFSRHLSALIVLAATACAPSVQELAESTAALDAETIVLSSPIRCSIPEICWIQNFFDHDDGPGATDHACGPRTFDGHGGLGIRVANLRVLEAGIPIIAASAGTVLGVRDGLSDDGVVFADASEVVGEECGNGVVLDHGRGWTTQYCHLERGSVSVKTGQRVARGDYLGNMGLSGLTAFPHLGFYVERNRVPVDPLVGPLATGNCHAPAAPLFEPALMERFAYVPTGLLNAGFTDREPNGREVLRGLHVNVALAADSEAIIFWVELFGTQPDDQVYLRIYAPDGSLFTDVKRPPTEGHSARHLAWAGHRPIGNLNPGLYRGVYQLLRQEGGRETVAFELERTVIVR